MERTITVSTALYRCLKCVQNAGHVRGEQVRRAVIYLGYIWVVVNDTRRPVLVRALQRGDGIYV